MKKIFMAALLVFSGTSFAQAVGDVDATKGATLEKNSSEDKKEGWSSTWGAAAGANIIENTNVIGQVDGSSTIYSLKLNGSIAENKALSEWISDIEISETMSKTPSVERFLKTNDVFKMSSIYKKFLQNTSWLGMYGRVEVNTAMFDGYDEQGAESLYVIAKQDGTSQSVLDERLKLTSAFKPLTSKESIGAVAKLMDKTSAKFEVRSGVGAKQISANGQYVVSDDKDTENIIEVKELQDVTVVGWEIVLELKGKFETAGIDYKVYSEALMPLSYTPKEDDAPENSKLVATEVGAHVGYALKKWLSLNYDFSSKKDPLLLPDAQVNHNFMLAVSFKSE